MLRSRMILSYLGILLMASSMAFADEVDDLIAQFRSADVFHRCYAAEQLGKLKDQRAVVPLLELLADPLPSQSGRYAKPEKPAANEPQSKVDVAKGAVASGGRQVLPTMTSDLSRLRQLMTALQADSIIEQKNAVRGLAKLRDKRSVPMLCKLLQEDRIKNGLKSDVIEALGEIGDPDAYDTIVIFLKQSSVFTKKSAVVALGKLGDSRACEPLYKLMVSDMTVRRQAADALKNIGGYDAVFYLNKAATSDDTFVKNQADRTLIELGPKHGLEPLLELLDDPDPQIQKAAARALIRLNDPTIEQDLQKAGVKGLSQNTQSDEVKVKLAAIEALSHIHSVKIIKPLMDQLADGANDPSVRRAAGKALAQYQNQALLKTFSVDLNDSDYKKQAAALNCLGYLGTDEAVELIVSSLSNPFLKKDVCKAMALTQNPGAAPYMKPFIPDPIVGEIAVDYFVELEGDETIEPLVL
ncbi:MAG: HEAT repeat domain-containing protein, partial [Planctomycetota bacterium]